MARRSFRNRQRLNQRANKKPKTSSAKRPKPQRSERQRKQTQTVSEKVKAKVRQVQAALAATGKKLTVIRGPKSVDSSWVDEIAYVRYGRQNGVAVKFLSGFEAFYPNTTIKDYEYLRDARSKGKAIWRRFYERNYQQLN